MSRQNQANHLDNDLLLIALRRKLRVPIFDVSRQIICKCTTLVDIYGDHFFSCTKNNKKRMHDKVRDHWVKPLQCILCDVGVIASPTDLDTEYTNIVSFAPQMRPYDIGWYPETAGWKKTIFRTSCPMMGIDITFAKLRDLPSLTVVSARKNIAQHEKHLQTAEKAKLLRGKRIDKDSDETIKGELVIADLLDMNHALIPGVIDQFSDLGPCLKRLLYGTNPLIKVPTFSKGKPLAKSMMMKVYSDAVPAGVLPQANTTWASRTKDDGVDWYGDSYLEANPSSWAIQHMGMGIVRYMAQHIKFAKYRTISASNTSMEIERSWRNRLVEVRLPSIQRLPAANNIFYEEDPKDIKGSGHHKDTIE